MKWFSRTLIAALVVSVLVVLVAGPFAKWALKDQLVARGAERVDVGRVYLNPLTGYLALSDLSVHSLGQRSLALEKLTVNVALLDLIQRRVRLSEVFITGLDLAIEKSESYFLVGVPLPVHQEPPAQTLDQSLVTKETVPGRVSEPMANESPEEAPEGASQWHWAVDQMNIESSSVKYVQADVELELNVTQLELQDIQSWDRESLGQLRSQLELHIIAGKGVSLGVQSLSLESELGLSVDSSEDLAWQGKGALKLSSITLAAEPAQADVTLKSLGFAFDVSGQASAIEGLLDIKAQSLSVRHVGQELLSVVALQASQLKLTSLEMISLDQLQVDDIRVVAAADSGIESKKDSSVDGAELSANDGAGNNAEQLLAVQELNVSNIELTGLNQLLVGSVAVSGLQAHLVRGQEGQLQLPELKTISQSVGQAQGSEQEQEQEQGIVPDQIQLKPAESAELEKQLFSWRLVDLQLINSGLLTFIDHGVSPAASHVVSELEVHGKEFVGADGVGVRRVQLQGKLNQFGAFSALLETEPSSQAMKLSAQVSALELPDYSPYLSGVFGYQFKSGQLFLEAEAMSENEQIAGDVDVRLNNVHLQPFDQAVIKRVSKQLAMPLDKALSTLRDKRGDVKITVPISGSLSEPTFSLKDLMRQVTVKALKTATVSVIKRAIQPYGTAITAVQLLTKAGKRITVIKVQDIDFAVGDQGLDELDQLQLNKLAELLKQKEKLRLNICAFTSRIEADSLLLEDALPETRESLALALASKRGKAVKRYLSDEQGIDSQRLYLCQSQVESKNAASSRVELSL